MKLARLSNDLFPSLPSFFDDLLSGDLMDWGSSNFADLNTTLPAINVKETDNEFMLEVAAPGMSKDDFIVDYENGRLTISSQRKDENEEKEGERVTRREFSYQTFQRSFAMPEEIVKADEISAKYEDGILNVVLPKREELKPKPVKHIAIS